MAALAKRLPLLAFIAVAAGTSEGGCNCEALSERIVQLEAEVKALRRAPKQVATNMMQHTPTPENAFACGGDWYLESNSDVEMVRGCRTAGDIRILVRVTDLTPLRSLEVAESLLLWPSGLPSLTGLESLRVVLREFRITDTYARSLGVLQSLVSVGTLQIVGNSRLESTTGLEHLTNVTGIEVENNDLLRSLTGLEGVTSLDKLKLTISNNNALPSLSGLEGLTALDELNIYSNDALQDVSALEDLVSVANRLTVESNGVLLSLAGLRSLRTAGSVSISKNPFVGFHPGHLEGALERLETVREELFIGDLVWLRGGLLPLSSLASVGALTLVNLPTVTSLETLGRLTYAGGWVSMNGCNLRSLAGLTLHHVGGLIVLNNWQRMEYLGGPLARGVSVNSVQIDDAAWPSCITPHERTALVSVVLDMNRSYVPQHVTSVPGATAVPKVVRSCKPESFGTFLCRKGQRCSFSVTGEENISISGRLSGCGACSESELQINVTQSGAVDLGYALTDAEAGLRSVCSCSEAGGPVAQLLLRGPRHSSRAVCRRGHDCVIAVDGEGLERTDHMVLTSSCNEGAPLLVADWTAENVYLLQGLAFHALAPARYQLCWRAPCTSAADGASCPAPERTYFHVRDVELLGVFPQDYVLVLGADDLSVPNVGFGVSDGDRMRLRRVCGEADAGGSDDMEASSVGRFFRFGNLTEQRVQPGTHQLCWCQEHDGVLCNAERHFMAETGTVQVFCPRGQQPRHSGGCEQCPAGTQQPEAGLKPCLQCPVGKFSRPGDVCEVCQEGYFAAFPGSMACFPCPRWQTANADATGCSPDPPSIALLGLFLLSVGAFCALLVYITRRRLSIVDVSLDQGRTIITTLGSHGFANFGRASFPVTLRKTGHPGLDSPSEPMRVRVKDAVRLELVTRKGEPIEKRLDTSMGTLVVPFPFDLYHQRWPLPAVVLLPVLLTTVMVLCFLVVLVGMITEALLGVAAVAPVFTAVSAVARWRRRFTPLARRLSDFSLVLAKQLPNPESCPKGPNRALSVGKLHDVLNFFRDFIRDRPAYYMDQNLLQPLTKPKRLSYAELVGCGDAEWFVSHFWGTAFEHFCTALQKHAEGACGDRAWRELRYWVCFCSNNQHHLADELGEGWEDSSFYVTLKSGHCRGTCMVLDDKALPLTRIWCIFELLQTVKLQRSRENFQGLLLCTSSGVLNTGGGSIEVAMALASRVAEMDLEKAEASSEKDRMMIQNQVNIEMGSFAVLNDFVTHEVHEMLVQAQRHSNEQFATVLELLTPHRASV